MPPKKRTSKEKPNLKNLKDKDESENKAQSSKKQPNEPSSIKVKEEFIPSEEIKKEIKQEPAFTENELGLVDAKQIKQEIKDSKFPDEDLKPIKKEEIADLDSKFPITDIEDLKPVKKEELADLNHPLNWETILENIRKMRLNFDAPVDTMGCHKCHDKTASLKDQRYQILLSLMLSVQTRDVITYKAMQRLIKHGCNLENILNTSEEVLALMLYPVCYRKNKAKHIKESSIIIRDQFGGDIPKTFKDLCKLKGVGPKIANLCMKTAWEEITGIGVDTHVHRISNRLGWVTSKTPEETRKQLEGWLPKDLWTEVNHLLVGFGQQTCRPVNPQCATCLNYDICPFGVKALKLTAKLKTKK